jgi:predicted enzyme related to lactoylglutathione lyase
MRPIVHLELHTQDREQASRLYRELLRWRPVRVETAGGSYLALALGDRLGGGIVECPNARAVWLPYVEVDRIEHATAHAAELGATVLLDPREGPAGWRSVVATPAGGEIALWQRKVRL